MSMKLVQALTLAASVAACGGGGGGNTPTSPTAATPQGSACSGAPITNVMLAIGQMQGVSTSSQGTVQVYGESLPFTAPPTNGDQVFQIIRNVVPCEYEMVASVASGTGQFNVTFGFPPGTKLSQSGGVDPASIVVLEAPDPRQSFDQRGHPACGQGYGTGGTQAPFTVRIRFRVVAGISAAERC